MNYKSLMGYGKKKKVTKEQSKPKINKILTDIKQELNEWSYQPPTAKRWSKEFGGKGLTEYEQLKEVGATAEYRKYTKKIDKSRDLFGREVLKFYELLRKKGLDDAAGDLLDNYKNNVIKFGKEFKTLIRKII